MKRNLKKIASLFISIAMAFSMLTFSCIQASAMTNQEGADWALARIGQWIDTDGYYGAQCKDFVNAFTQDNFGVTFPGKGRYAEGTKLNTHTTKVNLERDWLFLFGKSD